MTNKTFRNFGLLALAASLVGWRALIDPMTLAPESKLWVEGTSTVKSFTCKAPLLTAPVGVTNATAAREILAGEKAVQSARFDVAVNKMDCGNGTMNEHMWKALKAEANSMISFQMTGYELSRSADSTKGTLTGTLKIGGVEKPVTLPVALQSGTDGALRVIGASEVNMKDYDLKPPSLMLGTMKVREKVTVRFDLLLKP